MKQFGRIPCIIHTDHANLARLDNLGLERIDPKHFRWFAEVTQGGSLLIHRPGAGIAHRGPDGLSRNAEGRDKLILAKGSEWKNLRERIRGIMKAIVEGKGDDEDDQPVSIEHLSKTDPGKLEPLPKAEGLEVSRKYEQGNLDHKSQNFSRGGVAAKAKANSSFEQPINARDKAELGSGGRIKTNSHAPVAKAKAKADRAQPKKGALPPKEPVSEAATDKEGRSASAPKGGGPSTEGQEEGLAIRPVNGRSRRPFKGAAGSSFRLEQGQVER